jgi:class 3 adenylate cyclase
MKLIAALGDVSAEQWEFVTMTMALRSTGDQAMAEELSALSRASMTPEALLAFREATKQIDVTALLSQVAVPTLIMHRTGEFTPLSFSQEFASSIPHGQLHMMDTESFLGKLSERDGGAVQAFLGVSTPVVAPSPSSPHATKRHDIQTILFTDVEGSTALTQRLGDAAAREVLREHERITREALKAHGGSEVKTMGDGFMASFGSATKALECAVAVQQAFGNRETGGIRVRIGLNAGEPIAEDHPDGRGDLHGTAVITAARIAALAQGGEILVSDVVRQLVAGKGFLFSDRGDHALKGFEDPVRVYEVRWRESA